MPEIVKTETIGQYTVTIERWEPEVPFCLGKPIYEGRPWHGTWRDEADRVHRYLYVLNAGGPVTEYSGFFSRVDTAMAAAIESMGDETPRDPIHKAMSQAFSL